MEEPVALAEALRRETRADRIVVVDCVTLWLGKLFLSGVDPLSATQDLAHIISKLEGPVIFVSNEVGGGIVPDNALGALVPRRAGLATKPNL